MIPHVRKPKPEETPPLHELNKQIAEVVDLIERRLDGEELVIGEIEDVTLGIIADDNYDKLPEDIQGEVTCLNMHEIENPGVEDFIKARKVLKSYLKICVRRDF